MDKRENLLWQMILTIAFIAIAYVGYSLYYDNDGYLQLLDDFESEDLSSDDLQRVIDEVAGARS